MVGREGSLTMVGHDPPYEGSCGWIEKVAVVGRLWPQDVVRMNPDLLLHVIKNVEVIGTKWVARPWRQSRRAW